MTYRFVRFLGHDEHHRPYKPPLPLENPLAAYAPFTYETRAEALEACAADLSDRWAEVAAGKREGRAAHLGHFIVECRILPDGRITGGRAIFGFPMPGEDGEACLTVWDVDLGRAEIERITSEVDADGWVLPWESADDD